MYITIELANVTVTVTVRSYSSCGFRFSLVPLGQVNLMFLLSQTECGQALKSGSSYARLASWLAGCMYIYARTHINLKSGRREEQEEVKREEGGRGRAGNALARLEAFTFLCIENRKNAEPSSANKLAWT